MPIDDAVYPAEQVIADLRGFGFDLFVGEDGVVHGRPKRRGMTITLEMRAVIDRLQAVNDEVAEILRHEPERMEYTGVSVEDAVALGQLVKDGALELIGKVVYHPGSGLCDLTVAQKGVSE